MNKEIYIEPKGYFTKEMKEILETVNKKDSKSTSQVEGKKEIKIKKKDKK